MRSEFQAADIFTKSFSSGNKFEFVRGLVEVHMPWSDSQCFHDPSQPSSTEPDGSGVPCMCVSIPYSMPALVSAGQQASGSQDSRESKCRRPAA